MLIIRDVIRKCRKGPYDTNTAKRDVCGADVPFGSDMRSVSASTSEGNRSARICMSCADFQPAEVLLERALQKLRDEMTSILES